MKLRFLIMFFYFGICNFGIAQMGGFSKWEVLFSDATIKVEIAFQIKPCSGIGESNNKSKYRYRVTGNPKSTYNSYINWKMDYIDCNSNLYYRNNALNIGSNNVHFKSNVTDLIIYPGDEDFTCKSMDKYYYDVIQSYSKSYGGGIKNSQLRKATTSELKDIWDGKYGNNPERRGKLIAKGIDPDDVQRRINLGEGKPVDPSKTDIILYVYPMNVNCNSNSLQAQFNVNIEPNSTFTNYELTSLPTWCRLIRKNNDFFLISIEANNSYNKRADFFIVKAGDKEVKVVIIQEGKPQASPTTTTSSSSSKTYNKPTKSNCFNCPKTKNQVGVSLSHFEDSDIHHGIQIGLNYENLFKYGFGVRTGLLMDFYNNRENVGFLLPLHLVYRLNFSESFNLFGFYGAGLNVVVKSNRYSLPLLTSDYGAGIQLNHLQLILGNNNQLFNYTRKHKSGVELKQYKKITFTISLTFPLSTK
ncbi:MAG: hypothetical protein J5I52_06815 [Saprospiraceae bacterium]|nr:hypothetical protein [Saprospiraceae bacterium]